MSDLKMQIAFANILRKKTEAGAVAPAVPSVDATRGARAAASEQPEVVKRELAKRIALTMKVQEPATGSVPAARPNVTTPPVQAQPAKPQTSLAAAFGKLKR